MRPANYLQQPIVLLAMVSLAENEEQFETVLRKFKYYSKVIVAIWKPQQVILGVGKSGQLVDNTVICDHLFRKEHI